jgi:hypothetical protein
VTAFDVYGQAFSGRATNVASLNRLEDIYDFVDLYTENIGVDFIPGVAPGYNDTAVRSGNAPSPRYLVDAAYGPTTQGSTLREMLDRVALPHTDPDVDDLILVNSFNKWHEDTQIEPTIITPPTTTLPQGLDTRPAISTRVTAICISTSCARRRCRRFRATSIATAASTWPISPATTAGTNVLASI